METGPRVLVVDDHPLNLELASFVLEADGCKVETAQDAEQALVKLKSFAPDLILMDIQMPGIDGLTLTRHIKADRAMHPVVIVAFTAYAMKGDEDRMRAAGCDGYITKPIDAMTFALTVRKLWQTHRTD